MKTGVYFAHCPWPEIEAIHKRVLTALEEDRENDCLRLDLIKIVPYINGRESGFKYVFLNGRSVVIGNDRCHDVLWLFQGPDDGGVGITDKQFASPTRSTGAFYERRMPCLRLTDLNGTCLVVVERVPGKTGALFL